MIDPPRLLDMASDDFERTLLGSALADRGSDAAQTRALAALGSLGLGLAASTSAAATALAPGGLATTAAPKLTLAALAKWIGTGVVVGALSAGGVQALVDSPVAASEPAPASARPSPSSHALAVVASPSPPLELAPLAAASSVAPVVRERAKPLDAAALVGGGVEAVSSSNGAFPSEASGSRLGEELQALERVRQALRRGDASASLAALARYEARFPRGALAREATLLAVETKLAAGDVAGARAVADRVLATDVTSPHAKKIQALLAARGLP